MESTKQAKFNSLQIIYGAFIIAVTTFLAVVLYLSESLYFEINTDDVYIFVVPLLSVVSIFSNTYLFNNSLKVITPNDDLQTKFSKYQAANIVRCGVLEAPALLGIVATHNSGNYLFLIFSGVMTLVMLFYFPTKDKFINTVQLSFEEKSKLDTF